MEIVDIWRLFQQWAEHGNSGDLELDADGSGGIRAHEWQGDHDRSELVVSWSSLADGIKTLTAELTSGCPSMRAFNTSSTRMRRRIRQRLLDSMLLPPVTAAAEAAGGQATKQQAP